MTLITIPQENWENLMSRIETLEDAISQRNKKELGEEWIDSVNVRKMLGISPKTWQMYRDKGLIPYSKIFNKIFVKRSDLEDFMMKHYIPARA